MRPYVYTHVDTQVYVVSSTCACALQLYMWPLRRCRARLVLTGLPLFVVFARVSLSCTRNKKDSPKLPSKLKLY
jgi:hypothetical protein